MLHHRYLLTLPIFGFCLSMLFFAVSCESTKTNSEQLSTTSTIEVGPSTTTQETIAKPTAIVKPIQVSKEVFLQTFSEVETLIKNLNMIIQGRDFNKWLTFLSAYYQQTISHSDYLDQLNKSAILQRNNIQLKSVQDYFNFVVVPSRANLRLDDLVFLSETEVEAIMVVGNRRVTLYRLIKINDQWLIGLS